ncbi:MAG: SpoIIIAH-like family protein [Lachnospiraceae bacterium]|nr:SpoIIIAH-like family protein [Lachnospiraceae bacterium]
MMKKTIKKNQVVIAALTVLLGVAGYINFSGNQIDLASGEKSSEEATESAFAETDLEANAGEITIDEMEQEEDIELNSDEEDIGEAVLTSTNPATTNMVNIKLNREQVRSRSKEYYLEIINNDGMDEEAVASATDAYIKLTEDMEMEAEAETLLMAKGYTNAIVSISENSVDVVVDRADLSDTERAQIEDIVQRKTNCTIDQIVITSITQ